MIKPIVVDSFVNSTTIVVEGVTYEAHHNQESDCGWYSKQVCAFYSRIESCHTIPCLASQMRRLGNTDRKDVVWLAKA
jgi:cellulose synthase/poly-beta-1,6-N-acetylglucosamine synthase-like glycosyltransferase